MYNNLNLDHANIIAYTIFGKILLICSLCIEQKQKGKVNKWPFLRYKFTKK